MRRQRGEERHVATIVGPCRRVRGLISYTTTPDLRLGLHAFTAFAVTDKYQLTLDSVLAVK